VGFVGIREKRRLGMSLSTRSFAEFLGTFWLVFGGCGAAVIAAGTPASIGALGVALAFGLTVMTMAYAVGPISGGHFNPAVSTGLAIVGRFRASELPAYLVAQVAGAVVAASLLSLIASGTAGYVGGLAANGFGEHSPGRYSLAAGLASEFVLTFMFLIIILGVTSSRSYEGFAPIAIGLGLTLVHLVGIPVTNVSVNPARSTGPAFVEGGWALDQLWVFWVAPLAGAMFAALTYRLLLSREAPSGERHAATASATL
jgi:aquaporin Z